MKAVLGALFLGWSVVSVQAITIGPGPVIGVDKRGTVWYEEFQDWTYQDLRALDTNADQVYVFNDAADMSRDIVAFYSREQGDNIYFRVDFFNLGPGHQNGEVDVYVFIDCAPGGTTNLHPWLQTSWERAWNISVNVYDETNYALMDSSGNSHNADYLGSYWHSQLDAVEFGIKRSRLIAAGWNGTTPFHMQVVTAKDSTDIPGGSDVVDSITGTITRNTGSGQGRITGSVLSDASTSRAKYAVIAHANQSVAPQGGTKGHIYTDRSDINLHPGFIRLLDSAEMLNIPMNLHISGTLMMSFLWAVQEPTEAGYPDRDGPTFMQRCRDFVTTGPGSLIGGTLAEHIMPYFEGDVNRKSIAQKSEWIEGYFGLREADMMVMHVPERVIRSDTNASYTSAQGPLNGKTFEDIEASGFIATYLDEVTHLHWWYYPNEQDAWGMDCPCGKWAGGQGCNEETYHHKIHKINGVYTFMINDREDQSKFGNDDDGMMFDTRYTLLQKALHPDSSQITVVFDDWEAFAGNSFASPFPNNNADQFHNTLRWAANRPWIQLVNLKDVMEWAMDDPTWVIDQGYRYDLSNQTYEWLKRATEHSYDNWYYGSALEESFFARVPKVHNDWSPAGMKVYGDMNTPGTLVHDSWETIQSITSPALKKISEWSFSAMIYETAWHDEDANPDQYQSRNYQVTFNRNDDCTFSYEDTTWDPISGWALRLHGHVRDMGVMKAASDWVEAIKNGSQGSETTVYAADIDDDTLDEYVLCNDKVFLVIERWGARVVKAFVYDPDLNGGDAIMVVGVPISNPPEESENEGADNNRNSLFKDHWSTGMATNGYIDMDFAFPTAPLAGSNFWEFVSNDGRIRKRIELPFGRDVAIARYQTSPSIGTLYTRHGLGPNQIDLMFNGTENLVRQSDASYRGLVNTSGGAALMVRGANTEFNLGSILNAGWDNRNLPMVEIFELSNTGNATNFSMAVAFSSSSAWDLDGDGLSNTNEWLLGTDPFNPDTDGDGIPDGWEVAMGLNPLSAADGLVDSDGDSFTNFEEYIAGTAINNSNSFFHIAAMGGPGTGSGNVITHNVSSGRLYRIKFADAYTGQWAWQAFGNPDIPVGSYLHLNAPGWHSFTDDFTTATSGGAPVDGLRVYSVDVSLP